ncbi:MAG: alpha/beta hydrolase [Fimbriimonadaceae bacterium]|nr:alpha/beta hydrolase [Fimbriimonadaceae bacterium]
MTMAVWLACAAIGAEPVTYEVRTELDLVYGRAGEVDLKLDLFQPVDAPAPRPCVVFVHGGGWGGGERKQFHWHAQQLAAAGYTTVSVGYRLLQVAPYPACLNDCQRAVRWLRKHADRLGLDPQRIGAMGSSAGGHLVACLGVRDTRDDDDPALTGLSSRVQVVVDVHGIHDFPSLPPGLNLLSACSKLFGGTLAQQPALWQDASPQTHVNAQSAPMLILHDPADKTVPYDQSVAFATKLMSAGVAVQFEPIPGAGHGFVYNGQGAYTKRVWPWAVGWLGRWLRG